MAFDQKQGFWLIHSAPRFADSQKAYYYPGTAMKYGQSFFCMTFGIDQLAEIGRQVHVAQLSVTDQGFPAFFDQFDKLKRAVVDMKTLGPKSCSYNRTTALKTKGGQWLTSYEKHRRFDMGQCGVGGGREEGLTGWPRLEMTNTSCSSKKTNILLKI